MRFSIQRLLWKTDTRTLELRFAEALREIAVLWLTFAILDELIAGKLTVAWAAGNFTVSVVWWCLGTYIEIRNGGGHR